MYKSYKQKICATRCLTTLLLVLHVGTFSVENREYSRAFWLWNSSSTLLNLFAASPLWSKSWKRCRKSDLVRTDNERHKWRKILLHLTLGVERFFEVVIIRLLLSYRVSVCFCGINRLFYNMRKVEVNI